MRLISFIRLIATVAVLYCAAVGLQGCHKKNKDTAPTTVSYDFTVTGNTLVGYSVSFQSTAPAGSSYLWNFGDGTTSTQATPTHVYSSIDSFKVSLVINNQSSKSVSKKIYIAAVPEASIVSGIAGMKNWHGYVIAHFQAPSARDTISTLTDQFSIAVNSNISITVKGDVLDCYNTDNVNHIYYFRYYISQYSWREIDYYYSTDNICYIFYPDQGGDPQSGPYSFATVLWAP